MNDRLGDLGALPDWANESADIESGEDAKAYHPLVDKDTQIKNSSTDSSSQDPSASASASIMTLFFRDVEVVKADIDFLVKATSDIGDLNHSMLNTTSEEQEKELGYQLRVLIDQANKHAKNSKNMLALLKEENVRMKKDNKLNASDMRVRENLCNTLLRKFIDEIKAYQNAQHKYKSDLKLKIKRQVEIYKPNATEEEVNDIIKNGGREEYVKKQILSGGVSDQIKTTYAQVSGKYKDILTIEASLAELHQMFLDFALLTEQQGELLDQISFNVKNAVDYTEQGNVEVHTATEFAKEARKKQMIIAGIVVLVIVILIIIVAK